MTPQPRDLGIASLDVELEKSRGGKNPIVDGDEHSSARGQGTDLGQKGNTVAGQLDGVAAPACIGGGVLEQKQRPFAVGHVPVACHHRFPALGGDKYRSNSCSGNWANSPVKIAT